MTVPGGTPWDRGNEPMRLLQERAFAGDAEALHTLRWKMRFTDLSFRGIWLIYAGRVLSVEQRCAVERRP